MERIEYPLSKDDLANTVFRLVYAYNKRADDEEAWARMGGHPSPPEPNQIAAPQFTPAPPAPDKSKQENILPSGYAMRELENDRIIQMCKLESPPLIYAGFQLATIEAVCRFLERTAGHGLLCERLRGDAQARLEEARKG